MEEQMNANCLSEEQSILLFGLVSNGKSTLMNAFLGKSIMPTSNLSCTSIMVKVFDQLERNMYGTAFYLYGNAQIEYEKKDIVSALHYYNDGMKHGGVFCICESLKTLNRREFSLYLMDTPGINDAISMERSDWAKKRIFDGREATLLYVSHIRTCGTTDEEKTLSGVAKVIRGCEKNGWFFVINGWDLKDGEDEFNYIHKVRTLISKCGLPQPQIFFISALGALLSRKALSGDTFSRQEKKEFEHILRYYGLYETKRQGGRGRVPFAEKAIQEALFYSGVPRLEEALYQKMMEKRLQRR